MPDINRVLVLGAGFTKAFFDDAPLMWADYNAEALFNRCRPDSIAKQLIDTARSLDPKCKGYIDIEALMTRLQGGMPYDKRYGNEHDIQLLLMWLKAEFQDKIVQARKGKHHRAEMLKLAAYCVKHNITCITFNYDDLFDECLAESNLQEVSSGVYRLWQPDRDYGFLLSLAGQYFPTISTDPNATSMKLLKLHGSLNWRPKLGARHPLSIDALMHYADWPSVGHFRPAPGILDNLESTPFIVPPVLLKSEIVEEPILRLLWSRAYDALWRAEEVTFVGYSLPLTDIASRHLFSESLNRIVNPPKVTVISHADENESDKREALMNAYAKVLPWIGPDAFDFGGGLKWSQEFTK